MTQAQDNKEIARRFFAAIEAGDVDTIEQLQAPECTWWMIGNGDMSRKAFNDAVSGMLLTASKRVVKIIRMVAEDDAVALEIRSEFHFGERVYANEYHDLLVIRDGQIVHGREYFDTSKVAAFFGSEGE